MVWNALDTSTKVKTLAFEGRGSFSSMVGIVYLNRLVYCLAWVNTDAKFAVWFFFNEHVRQLVCRLGNRPNNPFFTKPFHFFIYPT